MHAGERDEDAFAEPIASPLLGRVRMVIAIVGGGLAKSHGSRDAMAHTAATSPLYAGWLATVPPDLIAAEAALASGDDAAFRALGTVVEANALAMHASAIAARPAVIYWQPATIALLSAVRTLRGNGRVAWATMDAGPHVKVLTTVEDADHVARALAGVEGVTATTVSAPGNGAEVIG
jgi:diphosphomevalonate decarboxylase